ncbi:MAG: hypothetical protein ACI8Z1_000699 [Candidatus Azotimanducaceae bacterium]|jgi:hypothetical protein
MDLVLFGFLRFSFQTYFSDPFFYLQFLTYKLHNGRPASVGRAFDDFSLYRRQVQGG